MIIIAYIFITPLLWAIAQYIVERKVLWGIAEESKNDARLMWMGTIVAALIGVGIIISMF